MRNSWTLRSLVNRLPHGKFSQVVRHSFFSKYARSAMSVQQRTQMVTPMMMSSLLTVFHLLDWKTCLCASLQPALFDYDHMKETRVIRVVEKLQRSMLLQFRDKPIPLHDPEPALEPVGRM